MINNAAVPMRRHATRLTMAEVERTMTTNYFSPVAITLAVLPRMLARRAGTIVNVSSLGGAWASRPRRPTPDRNSPWRAGASRWPSISTARGRVKLVLPGAIDTEIWDQPGNDAPLYDGPKDPPVDRPGWPTPSTAMPSSTTSPT